MRQDFVIKFISCSPGYHRFITRPYGEKVVTTRPYGEKVVTTVTVYANNIGPSVMTDVN